MRAIVSFIFVVVNGGSTRLPQGVIEKGTSVESAKVYIYSTALFVMIDWNANGNPFIRKWKLAYQALAYSYRSWKKEHIICWKDRWQAIQGSCIGCRAFGSARWKISTYTSVCPVGLRLLLPTRPLRRCLKGRK